jgi:hypothetical protein
MGQIHCIPQEMGVVEPITLAESRH